MARYRKKPVVIDAVQLTETNIKEIYEWVYDTEIKHTSALAEDRWLDFCRSIVTNGLNIPTLEDGDDGRAKHVASIGDYIIKGVAGEFYPCKPDIFIATYEKEDNG